MKADTITKDYVRDAGIFADIFNYYIYGGRQVILPEQLTECDSTKIALPYGADDVLVPVQRYRDARKRYAAMTDGRMAYVLYGTENHTNIHYAIPVKNNLYDALDYAGQVEEAAKSHRREMKRQREQGMTISGNRGEVLEMDGKLEKQEGQGGAVSGGTGKKPNSGEFLSGFWKEDRLIPTVTVTIYFGAEEWDGPLSLFDMMDVKDPELLACMNNYQVHLIAPAQMPDEEIMKFHSSLREVLFFIKYSKDREKLLRMVQEADAQRFRSLERRAVNVIQAITNINIKYDEEQEVVDMCQAIKEMMQESFQDGERKGFQDGERKGFRDGERKGFRDGERKGFRDGERKGFQDGERKGFRDGERKGFQDGERKGYRDGEQAGFENGEFNKAREATMNLYQLGIDVGKIAMVVGYDAEAVRGWLGLK